MGPGPLLLLLLLLSAGRGQGEPPRDGALGDVLEVLVAAELWEGVDEDAHSRRFWARWLDGRARCCALRGDVGFGAEARAMCCVVMGCEAISARMIFDGACRRFLEFAVSFVVIMRTP